MVLLLVFMQLARDLFAIAKFLLNDLEDSSTQNWKKRRHVHIIYLWQQMLNFVVDM